MTAEKAIEILSGFGIINRYCAEDAEALNMAIEALRYYAIQKEYRDRELDQDLFYFGDNHNW